MSDDEREYIPTRPQLWTCECGNEVIQLDALEPCESCEHVCCESCTHECGNCRQTGCEKCMVKTDVDGWAHKDQCAAALVAHEEAVNARYLAEEIRYAPVRKMLTTNRNRGGYNHE